MEYRVSDCGWKETHMTQPPLFTNKTFNHTLKYVSPNRRTTHFIRVFSVCKSVTMSVLFSLPESLKPQKDNTLKSESYVTSFRFELLHTISSTRKIILAN